MTGIAGRFVVVVAAAVTVDDAMDGSEVAAEPTSLTITGTVLTPLRGGLTAAAAACVVTCTATTCDDVAAGGLIFRFFNGIDDSVTDDDVDTIASPQLMSLDVAASSAGGVPLL